MGVVGRLVVGIALAGFLDSVAGAACEPWAGKAVSVQGIVESLRVGESHWRPVQLGDTFCPGDRIRLLENSRADIVLSNEAVMRLNENSSMTLEAPREPRTALIDLIKGAAHFFSRQPRSLEIKTPYTIAGVRGTEFLIRIDDGATFLSVFDGSVLTQSTAGELELTSGQSAAAQAGKAPVLQFVARPRDAVKWALYYPRVVYRVGAASAVSQEQREASRYLERAAEMLEVGQVDKARVDIGRALQLYPNFSEAYALQSIIAVVQNDRKKALELADRAVSTDPGTAAGLIARSYAQQANFDLSGARKSLEEAVRRHPHDALAWARLAEVRSMFGNLGGSMDAAQKAASLDPNLALTQTILGFAYLTNVKLAPAKQAFEQAIQLDQAAPLPRLGMGLARIREGNLQEGGREIEIAASLDPNNSLIRSYLGKTYYEEKRTPVAEREYGIAKELDPQDPTPWFYDAIAKQTTNRPVEALHNYQKSIELNDNRAVYRSRLLLDADLAARQSAVARIYNDLNFQRRALVEGWKSLNTDPSNYSAHRFLADSYAALPRHEIARVSELLQSQLLQPTNITPLQPVLEESNLFLISSQGPASLSYNTFNPLFVRNQAVLQADGLIGENSTYAGEGIVSGIYNKFSFSSGYTRFETDGWRENADQRENIANIFAQYELNHKTSIQAEYRHQDAETGDLLLRFFPEDVSWGLRNNEERDTYRFGIRHGFSPNSVLLGSFMYQDASLHVRDEQSSVPWIKDARIRRPEDAFSGEGQHLFRSQYVDLVSGVGYFDISGEIDTTVLTIFPPPLDRVVNQLSTDLRHTNLYAYSHLKPLDGLTFTLGASGDLTEGASPDVAGKNEFNPKFGVMWTPFANTLLRAAAFRVLKRTLITDQTLEPTQVAGFNQFYDDFNGTEAWKYGAAVDQKFADSIYGGVEFSCRDLETSLASASGGADQFDWREYLARVYLYWTPHKWIALRTAYEFERFERDKGFTDGIKNMDSQRVPLGLSFFHPSGLGASLQLTYYNQFGNFERELGFFQSGRDDFWLVDTAINYRLPKRYGFITLGVNNLFDQDFNYYETDLKNPTIQPDRVVFGRITLAFP